MVPRSHLYNKSQQSWHLYSRSLAFPCWWCWWCWGREDRLSGGGQLVRGRGWRLLHGQAGLLLGQQRGIFTGQRGRLQSDRRRNTVRERLSGGVRTCTGLTRTPLIYSRVAPVSSLVLSFSSSRSLSISFSSSTSPGVRSSLRIATSPSGNGQKKKKLNSLLLVKNKQTITPTDDLVAN